MPNYCDYTMRIHGTKENLDTFTKIIQANYSYAENTPWCSFKKHFWRVFEATVLFSETNPSIAYVDGYCAWSVDTCFFPNGYQKTHNNVYSTDILSVSKELQLTIEIRSVESGCQFSEFFFIDNGILLWESCLDYDESDYLDENGDVFPHKETEFNNLLDVNRERK